MVLLAYSLVVVLSYLLGSVPSGFLAGKMRGIDIRKAGSGKHKHYGKNTYTFAQAEEDVIPCAARYALWDVHQVGDQSRQG